MNIAIAMPTMSPPTAGDELTGFSNIVGREGKHRVKLAPLRSRSHRGGTLTERQAVT
jgi:hypothetical protein